MRTKIKIKEKVYNIGVKRFGENIIEIEVDDEKFFFKEDKLGEISLVKESEIALNKSSSQNGEVCGIKEDKEIKSPLSGTVSKVFVKERDSIKHGDLVLTLMAMKMENEIISETCGKIKELKVKEGQLVSLGDILVILN